MTTALSHCLPVPHILQSVVSVSLCPMLSATVFSLFVSTSHCTVCWFRVTMSTANFYGQTSLSVPHTLPSFGSVSLCPRLFSLVCPLPVSTSHFTVHWFCVTVSTANFYSLSTFCQYLTRYRLFFLCFYVQCNLLQRVHCLSVPLTVPSDASVSLCPLLNSSLSTVSHYLTLYLLMILCHYVHCYLL